MASDSTTRAFLKNSILKAVVIFLYILEKKFSGQARGVNKVSCRRGDSDFTLQEGGNGILPPMPTYGPFYGRVLPGASFLRSETEPKDILLGT